MKTLRWFVYPAAMTAVFVFNAAHALAAPRTVCWQTQILDARVSCPPPGTVGVTRGCNPAGTDHSDFVGGTVELWDKDTSGSDDYIGTWINSSGGTQCATFEWGDGSNYGEVEQHPDVYARMKPAVRSTTATGAVVRATDVNSNVAPGVTFRDVVFINDCAGSCTFSNVLWNAASGTASDMAQQFMIVDSAQRTLQVYSSIMDNVYINARYGAAACSTDADASSESRTSMCFAQLSGYAGDRPTHEMGHNLQKHLFEQDDLESTYAGGGWNLTDPETDSAATSEGWASYVAAVSWFNPQVSTVVPLYRGFNLENATPVVQSDCWTNPTSNRNIPGQSAKAFWDYDDINNEPSWSGSSFPAFGDDVSSKQTLWMATQWDEFPDGTGNGEDREPGPHGVNVQDYRTYAELSYDSFSTLLRHNCIEAQQQ